MIKIVDPFSVIKVTTPEKDSSPIWFIKGMLSTIFGVWQFNGGTKNSPWLGIPLPGPKIPSSPGLIPPITWNANTGFDVLTYILLDCPTEALPEMHQLDMKHHNL